MPTPPQDPAPFAAAPLPPAERAALRDASVRRVRRTTRWLLAGALGLTGAIAGVAAQQTLPASASDTSDRGTVAGATYDDGGSYTDDDGYEYDDEDGSSGSVQAPSQAPQPAPQSAAPSASSGAS